MIVKDNILKKSEEVFVGKRPQLQFLKQSTVYIYSLPLIFLQKSLVVLVVNPVALASQTNLKMEKRRVVTIVLGVMVPILNGRNGRDSPGYFGQGQIIQRHIGSV